LRFLRVKETQRIRPGGSLTVDVGFSVSAAEDEQAVDRVLEGDLSAFEAIVRRWQGPLVNMAYRFCHDRGRSEEMAQEAFVKAFRGLAKWRRDATFSTWLFALAANLYRTEIRRIPPATVTLDQIVEPADPHRTDSRLEDEDRRRVVQRALQSLPSKYREALVLFYFHGLDVATAARSLRLPEGTLKARLSRGRDMLRRKLLHGTR
jgi:RNA polymerase sigma-70 factor (ECF subfamily)